MERTFVILKPDAVQRGLMGAVISRFEAKGLKVVGAKFMKIPGDLAAKHYAVHQGKPFYEGLVKFMTSSPVLALALEGPNAIEVTRKIMGATNGGKAEAGTIRGDYGISASFNLVHGSDAPETAAAELALWFRADELVDYKLSNQEWVY